jgi:hypothetical protein
VGAFGLGANAIKSKTLTVKLFYLQQNVEIINFNFDTGKCFRLYSISCGIILLFEILPARSSNLVGKNLKMGQRRVDLFQVSIEKKYLLVKNSIG